MTELLTREASDFLREDKFHPFFLYVPYNAPHYPMHAPQKYLDRFPGLRRERQVHAAMIAAVDDSIGEIMRTLKEEQLANKTLVFFQSDNGASIEDRVTVSFTGSNPRFGGSNGPFRGYKYSLFEGGIHMPALMSWPERIPPKQVIGAPGIGMDMFVTAALAAGVSLPADRVIDGKDILPTVTAKAPSPHETLFWAQEDQLAVRKGNWKLVLNGILAKGSKHELKREESVFLADLENDPGETTNLRTKHPNVVAELTRLVRQWRQEVEH